MKNFVYLTGIGVLLFLVISCSKSDDKDSTSSDELYVLINESGYTYYRDTLFEGVGAHTKYVKVRFNSIAAAALDADHKLPEEETFPEGSMIVKEVFRAKEDPFYIYAVMLKKANDANAEKGWVWAELNPDGSIAYPLENKGVGCISCHIKEPMRDYVLVFDAHL